MAYCTASDVRLVIKTALTDAEIEEIIKMSDAEIEQRLGQQTPDDLVRKLSTLITAYTIKTRQPSAVAVGEYREETGDIHQKWETEITRLYRLKTKVTISGSGGMSVPLSKPYPPVAVDYSDWADLADNYAGKATTVIVDASGKGDYGTIQEAVNSLPT